jgi:hypothetical protein
MTQQNNPQKSELEAIHTTGIEPGSTTAEESPVLAIEREDPSRKIGSTATGPRTELGKQRASRNATKHGVYAKVIIIKGESRTEYERLWAGLREDLQSEGVLEELLVEKLVTTAWLKRRVFSAMGAEIQQHNGIMAWNPAALDCLIRYGAGLERDFDRTLSQLERLQRMRKGLPVLPKLDVHLS